MLTTPSTIDTVIPDCLMYASLELKSALTGATLRADRQTDNVPIGACPGDSGGPLYAAYPERPAHYVLLGITSAILNPEVDAVRAGTLLCALSGTQTSFTSVPAYREFIVTGVARLGENPAELVFETQ